jgi:hypothetical protein
MQRPSAGSPEVKDRAAGKPTHSAADMSNRLFLSGLSHYAEEQVRGARRRSP